ncbi:unnamed protein product [Leptidea sinapis]|uniref:Acyltransferase 3 domain-containing protein n=1 Tax=Leptidea sinapis TaxID=189913 RepID=A0A5E4R098_9NEOP|nr:unnamed protein product [Leptidea sinapis]
MWILEIGYLLFSVFQNWNEFISNERKDPRLRSFQGLDAIRTVLILIVIMAHVIWFIILRSCLTKFCSV